MDNNKIAPSAQDIRKYFVEQFYQKLGLIPEDLYRNYTLAANDRKLRGLTTGRARQTGRTTSMLINAIAAAFLGHEVFISPIEKAGTHILRSKLSKIVQDLNIVSLSVGLSEVSVMKIGLGKLEIKSKEDIEELPGNSWHFRDQL